MKKIHILFILSIPTLIGNYVFGQAVQNESEHKNPITNRIDFRATLNDDTTFTVYNFLQSLKQKGVITDENSTFHIYQEKNSIDFSCFNCLIIDLPSGKETDAPDNSMGGGWSKN